MIKGMLSNEHRGVRPVVYRVLEYCARLLHHMMAGSGGVVFTRESTRLMASYVGADRDQG